MAEYAVVNKTQLDADMTSVADTIRTKGGTSEKLSWPDGYNAAIEAIQTGGGAPVEVEQKEICFWDYDGTLRYSYSLDEIQELTELPPGPEHDGLVFQEWNWSLEAIKAQGRRTHIGALYVTDDGKTRMYIELKFERQLTVPLYIYQTVANGVSIDWGDGSATETISGTGDVSTSHTYAQTGNYVIALEVTSGKLGVGDKKGNTLLGRNTVHRTILRNFECGNELEEFNIAAFNRQMSLKKIAISRDVRITDSYIFEYCASLTCVVFPCYLSANYITRGCSSLETACVHENQKTNVPRSLFQACGVLRNVSIPADCTGKLDSDSFEACSCLGEIDIPDGCTSVYDRSFRYCALLTNITIPENVAEIRANGFYSCSGLIKIKFLSTTPPTVVNKNAFTNLSTDCIIEVPKGCLEAYTTATNYPSADTYTYVEASES